MNHLLGTSLMAGALCFGAGSAVFPAVQTDAGPGSGSGPRVITKPGVEFDDAHRTRQGMPSIGGEVHESREPQNMETEWRKRMDEPTT